MPLRPDDTLFRIWASAVITDPADRVLLSHRRDFDLWNLPGGKLDAGELPEDALRREVVEETGLELGAFRLIGVYAKDDGSPALTFSYRCHSRGQPRPSGEADLHLWLPLEDWPLNAHPAHRDRVSEALAPPGPVVSRRQPQPWGRDHLEALRSGSLPPGEHEPFQRDVPTPEHQDLVRHPDPGQRADALRVLGDHAESIRILEPLTTAAFDAGETRAGIAHLIRLGTARFYAGDHDAAALDLWKAISLSTGIEDEPFKDFAYQHLGKCCAEQHRWREAVTYLRRAEQLRRGKDPALLASTRRALEEAEERRRASRSTGGPHR